MSRTDIRGATTENSGSDIHSGNHAVFHHVLACVDSSPRSHNALAHAAAIAKATGARLSVLRVIEPPAGQDSPTDPVDWTFKHRKAEAELRESASRLAGSKVDTVVVDGMAAERICEWVHENDVDLTVLGVGNAQHWPYSGLGATARRVVDTAEGSVLLTPGIGMPDTICYQRVMTPLDGSSRAECALPIAVKLAAAHGSEILLVHAAPNIDLTETGPLEPETFAMRDRLRRRNELVGAQYLKKIQTWLPVAQARNQAKLIASGDPRLAIGQAINDAKVDIIVLSSTGHSGRPDVLIGSVADFLVTHATTPILLVRGREAGLCKSFRGPEDPASVRLPTGAQQ